MKYLLIAVLLTGCSTTVTVHQKFPSVPDDLKQACPELKLVDESTTKLSDVVSVVSDNYATSKECKIRVDSWIEWYNTQKKIYESVK